MNRILRVFIFVVMLFFTTGASAQVADSLSSTVDTVKAKLPLQVVDPLKAILDRNAFFNASLPSIRQEIIPRKGGREDDNFFYILTGVIFLFAVARAGYAKYFSNLFRVFFNSSLRQGQLTDQLVQDQLPSLVFNLIFVISAGLYFYFVIRYYNLAGTAINWRLMAYCVIGTAAIYLVKYISLKFTGWITGFGHEADTYTFIIFLINKIIGICLLPIIVVLAFSDHNIANIFIIFSFILIGLLMLMRFFRSYGLLQSKIRVSRFHFFLYIFSVEILPLFIIYKAVLFFFDRNL
jgi:hypothetical protein